MSAHEDGDRERPENQLLDSEMKTVTVGRRSFITRALGAGAVVFGAALSTACEEFLSTCDSFDRNSDGDRTRRADPARRSDADPNDPVRRSDFDRTTIGDSLPDCR